MRSSEAVSSCKQYCLHPLSPRAGQKPFRRVCSYQAARAARRPYSPSVNPEGDGALENAWPHQKTKKKRQQTTKDKRERERERKTKSLRPIEPRNPRKTVLLAGRGKTPQDLREKNGTKSKRKTTCPPKGQKTQLYPCGNLSLIFL